MTLTPQSVSHVHGRSEEGEQAVARWQEAVVICNDFLESDFRKTLPKGEIVWTDRGMSFVSGEKTVPIVIRCCAAGDLLIPFKMAAQERSDGFVVGSLPPHRNRELDNSFFKHSSTQARPSYRLAELILHELTHTYFHQGTVSLPKTIAYYAEAIFLFRYRTHSMEILPYRTSHEVSAFVKDHFERQRRAS